MTFELRSPLPRRWTLVAAASFVALAPLASAQGAASEGDHTGVPAWRSDDPALKTAAPESAAAAEAAVAPEAAAAPEAAEAHASTRSQRAFESALEGSATLRTKAAPSEATAQIAAERGVLSVDASAQPGVVWASGAAWKASFGAEGIEVHPRVGPDHPSQPTRFHLRRASVGGAPLALSAGLGELVDGATVAIDRGALREVYHLAVEAFEQTFVFEALPASGDLVLELDVASPWMELDGGDALRFSAPGIGELTYSAAFVYDADGRRATVARERLAGGFALRVPAAFVASATLPLTVDPVISVSTLTASFGHPCQQPDVAFEAVSNAYWCVYEDVFSATDTDLRLQPRSLNAVMGAVAVIDITTASWDQPSVAAAGNAGQLLVAARTRAVGASVTHISARQFDTVAQAPTTAPFQLDVSALSSARPDVGGAWPNGGPANAAYLVVWEREFNATDHDIHGRVVEVSGALGQNVLLLENAGVNAIAPAVSKSRGDEQLAGDFWNVAWIRDDDQDGSGTPYTQRVSRIQTFSTAFAADATSSASFVDVSSTLDLALPGSGDRPWFVVYRVDYHYGDIALAVCATSGPIATRSVTLMEDFDRWLTSSRPKIAVDGRRFAIAFEERYWGSVGQPADMDVYAVTGALAYGQSGVEVALSERHLEASTGLGVQGNVALASRWDGGGGSNELLVAWQDGVGVGARVALRGLAGATPYGAPRAAIGAQYCEALAHNSSASDGRRSSYIWAEGTASVNELQTLHCVDMPANVFAYFIVSADTGSVTMPGGSRGRLCLGGAIGRRVGGAVLQSGAGMSVSTDFDPQTLPTPNGTFAAQAGQALHFQCWHRDVYQGAATSNFSNACSIMFRL
ncbi:MAG: hypothetical protein R3F49_09470 [Planctomycetota bacterium]